MPEKIMVDCFCRSSWAVNCFCSYTFRGSVMVVEIKSASTPWFRSGFFLSALGFLLLELCWLGLTLKRRDGFKLWRTCPKVMLQMSILH